MSLDTRARNAVQELRHATAHGDITTPGLREIPQRLERRRRSRRAALAVGSLVVVAAAAGFAGGRIQPDATIVPSDTPSVAPSEPCSDDVVTCLGDRTYRVALPVPVTVALPPSFDDVLNDHATNLELYNGGIYTGAGVTIMQLARPVEADGSAAVGAGTGAAAVARWLAERPFVQPTTPREATVGGLPGYRVDVVHRPGADLPATKGTGAVALAFRSDGFTAAVSPELRYATFYVLDAPDGSLIVIWSWTNDGPATELASNEAVIDDLRFG
jgi:anti-sigma factor RsiW